MAVATRLLADSILALHAALVLFNVLAPLWCWRRPRWRLAHLSALGLTVLSMALLGRCPLTDLENRLRPGGAYSGGFLAHWLEAVVYWDLPQGALGVATGLWFGLWAGVYALLTRRERRPPAPGSSP